MNIMDLSRKSSLDGVFRILSEKFVVLAMVKILKHTNSKCDIN